MSWYQELKNASMKTTQNFVFFGSISHLFYFSSKNPNGFRRVNFNFLLQTPLFSHGVSYLRRL